METHSSILAWKTPWTEEPCGLQFMRLQRVGHDWSDSTHTHLWAVVLEKTLEDPLDSKEIKPVNPKGPWILIERTDAKAEAPIFWPPDAKTWLIGKDPDAGKDWRQKKRAAEDEMVGWHHGFKGHESEQTHVHWVDDAMQPSHYLSPPSAPALSLSLHQGMYYQCYRQYLKHGTYLLSVIWRLTFIDRMINI